MGRPSGQQIGQPTGWLFFFCDIRCTSVVKRRTAYAVCQSYNPGSTLLGKGRWPADANMVPPKGRNRSKSQKLAGKPARAEAENPPPEKWGCVSGEKGRQRPRPLPEQRHQVTWGLCVRR